MDYIDDGVSRLPLGIRCAAHELALFAEHELPLCAGRGASLERILANIMDFEPCHSRL